MLASPVLNLFRSQSQKLVCVSYNKYKILLKYHYCYEKQNILSQKLILDDWADRIK